MSVFDKRGMWTISTSNYANYLQCMTAQNDVEEDKPIDAKGNPTLDSLRLCELYSTGIFYWIMKCLNNALKVRS